MALFKKYKLNHETKNGILYVRYTGKLKKKEIEEIMSTVYKLAVLSGTKKMLIDALESELILELKESLEMAGSQPEDMKLVKTAIVEKKEKENQYKMFEMFAKNRNFPMKFFNKVNEAEQWLKLN